jgi:fumarate hydratase, class II
MEDRDGDRDGDGDLAGATGMGVRVERDSMGEVSVPADRYWGSQTQRSLEHFDIGRDRFVWGRPLIEAFGLLKSVAARANAELGELDAQRAAWIVQAAEEVARGEWDDHFPLVVFQTGSGTHTNMNANEVIANRAIELAGGVLGSKTPVHPNDHVNRGQSSNDTFPTAAYVAAMLELDRHLVPRVESLCATLAAKADSFADVVKVGRTHLQDATPITLGQEIGAWVAQVDAALRGVQVASDGLLELAIGGTAVGTGLNAHPRFGDRVAALLAERTGFAFTSAADKFSALASHDALVATSAALRTLAGALTKMTNDVRWLASGPRAGIGELLLPENEPGSSIMPGKVNPTQSEALLMVAMQVFGNDTTVALAGSQGAFQLNVAVPVMLHGVLESIRLLGDACASFDGHCARGLEPDRDRIADHLAGNLMLVTALAPHLGYDVAATIAKHAHLHGTTLRQAALGLGLVTADDYDRWVHPEAMTRPHGSTTNPTP